MNDIFQLLASGITVAWDPEELTKNFPVVGDTTGHIINASIAVQLLSLKDCLS